MIFIYEDELWRDLLPLVHLRPVFDLRCGCRTLFEKFQALYPRERFVLLVRPELSPLVREQHPGVQVEPLDSAVCNLQSVICNLQSVICNRSSRPLTPLLFLSGRAILDKPLPVKGIEEVFVNGREIVGFRVNPARLRSSSHQPPATSDRRKLLGQPLFPGAEKGAVPSSLVRSWRLPERKVLASIVRYPWNLVEFNEPELVRELRLPRTKNEERRTMNRGFVVIGDPRNLIIARGVRVEPGVVFDVRLGRIRIDERAEIRARSVVAGPCHVGPGTVIDAALVRPGCSFGPDCRIGGEVEASVFLGHANKHHEGFLGHAVIGEWVNLGAMTANSDLRNDYGEVKVVLPGVAGSQPPIHADEDRYLGGRRESAFIGGKKYRLLNTGLRKFGCVIGDHAKTAIGSRLNTGAVLGIFANWFEPGLSPRVVPDFGRGSPGRGCAPMKTDGSRVGGNRRSSAAEDSGREPVEELLATARIVMSRRGVRLSPDYERLVRRIYARR